MQIKDFKKIKPKDLIVFDLDGTLVRTKSPMDRTMAELMAKLLAEKKVAIIGGGKYEVFQELFLTQFKKSPKLLAKLFLFPTTGTAFYRYDKTWKQVYAHKLSAAQVKKIENAFEQTFKTLKYKHPEKTYGDLIENRGTQVSFSVYGQDLVTVLGDKGVKMKEEWKRKYTPLKMKIAKMVAAQVPEFEVRAAGFTTIDVTKKGIDKGFGIQQMQKYLKIPVEKMLFIGDALEPGGNDYAVVRTGIDYIKTSGPEETKKIIRSLIGR